MTVTTFLGGAVRFSVTWHCLIMWPWGMRSSKTLLPQKTWPVEELQQNDPLQFLHHFLSFNASKKNYRYYLAMILHEVRMVFPSCVLTPGVTLFTSWWLQTLPPTYLRNLDPGLWPDPIGVWRVAQWNHFSDAKRDFTWSSTKNL